jgi:hypothetical protein
MLSSLSGPALLFALALASVGLQQHVCHTQTVDSTIAAFQFVPPIPGSLVDTTLTVSMGDNVSMQCNYPADTKRSVRILRWHPDKTQMTKFNTRKSTPIVVDKDFDVYFLALMGQFSEFSERLSSNYDPYTSTVTFTIRNFQYEDAGDFGCVATRGQTMSQTANLTIRVKDKVIYPDLVGNEQTFLPISTGQTVQKTVNCSLYHVYGLENAQEYGWFDTCELFDARGAKLVTPKCSGNIVRGSLVDKTNFTDQYRYGEYWPRSFDRTTIQATFPITSSFYNKTITCFGKCNDNVTRSDFMAIVQPGVDLHLDPANFRCTPHHVGVAINNMTAFSCVVFEPNYRKGSIYWEVIVPPARAGLQESVHRCKSTADCYSLKNIWVSDVTSVAENLYVTALTARLQVRADANTAKYRYRLVAEYPTRSYRSDNFTMLAVNTAQSGAVQGKNSAAPVSFSAPIFFLTVLAAVFSFSVTASS